LAEEETKEEREARRRQQWRESPESKRFTRVATAIWLVALIIIAIQWYYFTVKPDNSSFTDEEQLLTAAFVGVIVVPGVAMLILLTIRSQLVVAIEDRRRLGIEVKRLQEEERSLAEKSGDSIALPELWASTQKRIDWYHEIATTQARQSFRNGQIAAATGFFVILVVAVVAGFTSEASGSIAASVIGVAGAGLAAYIGGTFLKAQSEASEHLRSYFLQPVEFSRVLGAERLIETIKEDSERSKAVQEIVKAMMTPNPPKASS